MARRNRPERRPIAPDPRYNSVLVQILINKLMRDGKKSTSERVVYKAFDRIQAQASRDPLDVFNQAVRNATPVLEVKPRRVGGATYQVPVEIRPERRVTLSTFRSAPMGLIRRYASARPETRRVLQPPAALRVSTT